MSAGKKNTEEKNTGTPGIERPLRDAAEKKLANHPKIPPDFAGTSPEQLIHELRVHQIELEAQTEELRLAQLELEKSRDKFFDLYEFAPTGYLTLNDKALITEANLTSASLLGIERSKLVNHGLGLFIDSKSHDAWDLYFANVRQHVEKQICSLMLIRRDGSLFPAHLEGVRTTRSDGTITVRIAISDITDIWQIEALRESEEKYHNLYRNLALGIFHSTFEGRFIDLNPALAKMLGYNSPEEVLLSITNIAEQVYNESFHRPAISTTSLDADVWRITSRENQYRRRDGTLWYGMLHLRVVPDIHGKPSHYEGIVEDITGRKQMENELRLTQSRLELAMETGRIAWWEMDCVTGNIIFNKRKAQMLGYPAEKFSHYTDFTKLIHPEDHEISMQAMRDHISGIKKLYEADYRINSRNDEYLWFHDIGGISEYASNGRPLKVTGFVMDITDRKQADDKIKTSETRYHRLFESAQDGILILNRETGEIIDSNPYIERLTGYAKEELIGKPIWDIGFIKDQATSKLAFAKLQSNEYIRYEDLPLEMKDGRRIDVEFISNVYPIDPHISVIQCNIRDITDRKRAEEALIIANNKISLLSSITRHDIKNKVIVIHYALQFARQKQVIDEIEPFLDEIHNSVNVIEHQIDFSKDYQDLGVRPPEWLNLSYMITLTSTPAIQIVDETGTLQVFADPLFEKVPDNLIDNTIRHGETATEVHVSFITDKDDIRIIWTDNGVGVPAEEKEMIFNRGYGKNTGLGLFLIREILAITGITIQETGEPGEGAQFEITVPNGKWRIGNDEN